MSSPLVTMSRSHFLAIMIYHTYLFQDDDEPMVQLTLADLQRLTGLDADHWYAAMDTTDEQPESDLDAMDEAEEQDIAAMAMENAADDFELPDVQEWGSNDDNGQWGSNDDIEPPDVQEWGSNDDIDPPDVDEHSTFGDHPTPRSFGDEEE